MSWAISKGGSGYEGAIRLFRPFVLGSPHDSSPGAVSPAWVLIRSLFSDAICNRAKVLTLCNCTRQRPVENA